MWTQLDLARLISDYSKLIYPFILLLILNWIPMPYYMLFGRWKRW